jgi:hypothetical protein
MLDKGQPVDIYRYTYISRIVGQLQLPVASGRKSNQDYAAIIKATTSVSAQGEFHESDMLVSAHRPRCFLLALANGSKVLFD